jgi:predicted Rossmann fold flavoprotein
LRVVVIGGGPAGMMAAGQAALGGAAVTLLERNNKLGRKLAITGKGRGNLTNDADIADFIPRFGETGSFLYGPLYRFDNHRLRNFFGELGVPTKVERGGRVFPVSERASDLVQALSGFLDKAGVRVMLGQRVTAVLQDGGRVCGVSCGGRTCQADRVILATGGASYPTTGSTGDGYRLAASLGHNIVSVRPALVPLETEETWVREATGLSLRNVEVTLYTGGKKRAAGFGEMLFTHYGVSGPIILTLSRLAVEALQRGEMPRLVINLKPALSREKLSARVMRDFGARGRKLFKNSLDGLLPAKLAGPVINLSGIDPETPVNQISKGERNRLAEVLGALPLTVKGHRPLAEAIVTAGGVDIREIDPGTMSSKLVRGLFLAGEVIDVAGDTGGYNLQSAFSTGFVAGLSAAEE